jgi:chloramphenicol-sensitive protein RarD
MALSATAIAVNWLVFIWAVAAGRVLECSLGYFLTPLVSVTLGVIVLGERLNRVQWVAVSLAALGALIDVVFLGSLPWVSLTLAVSFGGYGLLRKTAPVDAMDGLFIEAVILTPPALGFLLAVAASGEGAFGAGGWRLDALLAFSGPLTALPLILFVEGSRRIRLATVGLLQYITPTCQLLLAVGVYGEAFTATTLASFVLIWAALALYSFDTFTTAGRQ